MRRKARVSGEALESPIFEVMIIESTYIGSGG